MCVNENVLGGGEKIKQPEIALMRVATYEKEVLCEIYERTNSFQWDDRLGEKPEKFDVLPDYNSKWWHIFRKETKWKFTHPICEAIRVLVGEKELLRYHHVHNLGRTDEEFEQFWNVWQIEKVTGKVLQPLKVPHNISRNDSGDNSEDKTQSSF